MVAGTAILSSTGESVVVKVSTGPAGDTVGSTGWPKLKGLN